MGDGLGRDGKPSHFASDGKIHSSMGPLNLGHSIGDKRLDQPSDRPTEDEAFENIDLES